MDTDHLWLFAVMSSSVTKLILHIAHLCNYLLSINSWTWTGRGKGKGTSCLDLTAWHLGVVGPPGSRGDSDPMMSGKLLLSRGSRPAPLVYSGAGALHTPNGKQGFGTGGVNWRGTEKSINTQKWLTGANFFFSIHNSFLLIKKRGNPGEAPQACIMVQTGRAGCPPRAFGRWRGSQGTAWPWGCRLGTAWPSGRLLGQAAAF